MASMLTVAYLLTNGAEDVDADLVRVVSLSRGTERRKAKHMRYRTWPIFFYAVLKELTKTLHEHYRCFRGPSMTNS